MPTPVITEKAVRHLSNARLSALDLNVGSFGLSETGGEFEGRSELVTESVNELRLELGTWLSLTIRIIDDEVLTPDISARDFHQKPSPQPERICQFELNFQLSTTDPPRKIGRVAQNLNQ